MLTNDYVIGALGQLQFDVVAHRLKHEYGVDLVFESYAAQMARWVTGDAAEMELLQNRYSAQLARDSADFLVYLAPNHVYLNMVTEKFPKLKFLETREMV